MTDENWDDFRVLLALAHKRSVAGAARELGVNETTVTRRLTHIETALDAQLFERVRGRVIATASMRQLVGRLEHVRDELQRCRDRATGANERLEGSVCVTTMQTIADRVIVPALPDFLSAHPGLQIELLADSAVLGIANERAADIAIRGARPDGDLNAVTRKLGTMGYGVYCRQDLLERGQPIPWLAYTDRTSGRVQADWIDARLREDGGTAIARFNRSESLNHALLEGLGKSVLAEPLAARFPTLTKLPCDVPLPEREFWMVMHPSYRDVRRIERVAHWLTEVVQRFLASA